MDERHQEAVWAFLLGRVTEADLVTGGLLIAGWHTGTKTSRDCCSGSPTRHPFRGR